MSASPPFPGLTAELVAEFVSIRGEQRRSLAKTFGEPEVDAGACWLVAEEIAMRYGWWERGGCYVDDDSHYSHEWNLLPDGRILDATADQFGEPAPGIRIASGDDPRYDGECDCEGSGPYE